MSLPGKSRYVMDSRPAPRAGVTLFCRENDVGCRYTQIVLAEKDVDSARVVWVNAARPNQDLLVLNPGGQLPTLADRDTVLFPALIVAEYLDERYPHPRLMPIDPAARARLRMVLSRLDRELFPLVERILAEPRAADARQARKELATALVTSSRLFGNRGWCLGLDFNLADCAWAALFGMLPTLQVKLPAEAHLNRYAERLLARATVQSVLR